MCRSHFLCYLSCWPQVWPQSFHHLAITHSKPLQPSSTVVYLSFQTTKKSHCLQTALSSIKGSYNNGTKGRESLPSQNLLYCHIKYRYILTLLQVQIFRSKYLTRDLVPIAVECRDCKSNLIKYCLLVCVLGQKHYLEHIHVCTEQQHV